MSDIFREIDEELREDRMKAQLKRWGPIVGTVAVLIIAGVAGWMYWQDLTQRTSEAETALLIQATTVGDGEALAQLAAEAGPGVAVLARLRAGAVAAAEDDLPTAISWYEGVSADSDVDAVWRDYASFMVVWLQLDSGDTVDLRGRLAPLAAADHALTFSAREALALLDMRDGRRGDALAAFQGLSEEENLPPATFRRVGEMIAHLTVPSDLGDNGEAAQ